MKEIFIFIVFVVIAGFLIFSFVQYKSEPCNDYNFRSYNEAKCIQRDIQKLKEKYPNEYN